MNKTILQRTLIAAAIAATTGLAAAGTTTYMSDGSSVTRSDPVTTTTTRTYSWSGPMVPGTIVASEPGNPALVPVPPNPWGSDTIADVAPTGVTTTTLGYGYVLPSNTVSTTTMGYGYLAPLPGSTGYLSSSPADPQVDYGHLVQPLNGGYSNGDVNLPSDLRSTQ